MLAVGLSGLLGSTGLGAAPTLRAVAPAESPSASVTACGYRQRSTNVRTGPTDRRRIALTFDDGPSAYTPRILDVLEREGVPATFFVVGRNIAGREALLVRMLEGGSMIANHSFTHVDLSKASSAALAQIDDTQAAIRTATGLTPCLLRPPFGLTSRRLLGALARRRLTSTLWSVNPQDFRSAGTATIRQRVLARVKAGSIVLLHDGGGDRSQTAAAVAPIVETLKARGYTFVTVTDLLGLRLSRTSP